MRIRQIALIAVMVLAAASSMALAGPGTGGNQGAETPQHQNMLQNRFNEFLGWVAQWAYGFGPGDGTGICDQDCQGAGDCDCDGAGDQDQRRQRERKQTPGTGPGPGSNYGNDGGNANGLRTGGGTGICQNDA